MEIGKRAHIIYAVKERLEKIKTQADGGDPRPGVSWSPEDGEDYYPVTINKVLLEPEDPVALDRDRLLPCVVVQYSDGKRMYESTPNSYNTINEVEETMILELRSVFRAVGNKIGDEDIPITIMAANIQESIDAALGPGHDLTYTDKHATKEGQVIDGMRTIKTMRWKVPFDLWTVDYMVIDFPISICHVFPRGKGV